LESAAPENCREGVEIQEKEGPGFNKPTVYNYEITAHSTVAGWRYPKILFR
jgi:hypothetical protein